MRLLKPTSRALLLVTLVATLFLLTLAATQTAAQARDDPYVNLSVDVEVGKTSAPGDTLQHGWVITARNRGTAAAYGVVVDLEFEDEGVNEYDSDVEWTSGTTCSGNLPGPTTCRNAVWTVGRLGAGEEVVALVSRDNTTQDSCCYPARAVIKNTIPVEAERLKVDNVHVGWMQVDKVTTIGNARPPFRRYWLEASVDDLFPDPGDTLTFTFKAARPTHGSTIRVAKLRLKLDDGMGTPTASPPTGSTFGAATGLDRTWDWDFDIQLPNFSRTLEVSTTLANPLPAGVALSDLCLTAEMRAAGPKNLSTRPTSAEICLGEVPVVVLETGETDLLDVYSCVGVTTYPCSSADTLELVINGKEAAEAAGVRKVGASAEAIMDPANVVVQVKDPDGRGQVSGSAVWRTGSNVPASAHTVGIIPGVVAFIRWPSTIFDDYSFSVSESTTGENPGTVRIIAAQNVAVTLLNSVSQKTFGPFETVSTSVPILIEFGKLGTYRVDMTAGAFHNPSSTSYVSDTSTYTFHVGPIADLGVSDGGSNAAVSANRRAFTITTVSNGPDDAPAAQVAVTGLNASDYVSHNATAGSFDPSTGIWTIGEMPNNPDYNQEVYGRDGEVLTIITSAAVDAEITAAISNTQDYEVCIDSSGEDVDLASPSQSACTATSGNTWHTAKYYDYRPGNNTATIKSRAGTGEHPDAPKGLKVMETPAGNILMWQRLESVNGRGVTHYEVQRSSSPWSTLSDDLRGTIYLDMDGGPETNYRVRGVNDWDHKGPWSTLTVEDKTPETPGNFAVVLSANGNAAVLSWTAPTSPSPVTGYVIDISDSAAGDNQPNDRTVGAGATTWTHSLNAGDVKFYRVRARNRDGVGPWTGWLSVGSAPGAPTSLQARANGPSEVVLTWSEASSQDATVDQYEIIYTDVSASEPVEDWPLLAVVHQYEGSRYVDESLMPGETRYYRVRALTWESDAYSGEWSNVASATTSARGPDSPGNLSATAVEGTTDSILVSWDASASGDASHYNIEHSSDGGDTWESERRRHVGTCDVNGETKLCYTDSGLFSGTSHWYRVAGVNNAGAASEWSEPVDATTGGDITMAPGEPQNLRVVSVIGRQVLLSWDAPEENGGSPITGYEYRAEAACEHDPGNVCQVVRPTRTGGTSVTVTVPNVKGNYSFYVRAVTAFGSGWWSQPAEQFVDPQRTWRVSLSPSSLQVPEGGEATYRVKLTSDPGQPVMVALWWDGDEDVGNTLQTQQFKWLLPSNYASQNPDIYLDREFTAPWNVGVTITVTADDDGDSENGTAQIHNTVQYVPCADLGNPAGCEDDPEDTGVNAYLTATEVDND